MGRTTGTHNDTNIYGLLQKTAGKHHPLLDLGILLLNETSKFFFGASCPLPSFFLSYLTHCDSSLLFFSQLISPQTSFSFVLS